MAIDIDTLTLGQIREIQSVIGAGGCNQTNPANYEFFGIGKKYFIRTVTHHYTGELIGFDRGGRELVLKNCAWIADDGRFEQAIRDSALEEVEPYPSCLPVLINRDTIIDAVIWSHDLPLEQK